MMCSYFLDGTLRDHHLARSPGAPSDSNPMIPLGRLSVSQAKLRSGPIRDDMVPFPIA